MKRSHFKVGAALASSLVAGCGGGSGASSSPVPNVPKSPAGTYATFVVKVPAKGAAPFMQHARRPHYITSNVQGIGFSVSDATNPNLGVNSFFPLTPASPGCSGSVPSGVTCTLNVIAPPGNDTFAVSLYDTATEPYGGYVISTGTLTQTINAGVSNTINIVTDGVPTFAIMGFANPYPSTLGSYPLSVDVTDPSGDIIVGSYDAPLTLTDSDSSGKTSLSKTTLAQASDASGITLNWNGLALVSPPATISLSTADTVLISELGSPTLASTAFSPSGIGVAVSPGLFYFANASAAPIIPTLSLQNGAITPVSVTNNCSGYISVSGSYPTISLTPMLATAPLSGGLPMVSANPGTCSIVLSDFLGHQTTVGVIVGQ